MKIENIIKQLGEDIKKRFSGESSGHDIYHLKRTLNLALHIQKYEGGDKVIIAIAAFLHDIHRIMQNKTGKVIDPKDSLIEIKRILSKVKISAKKKEKILHCIEFHEEYDFSEDGKTTNDLETLILQDADNLDAIGAIGIARTFSYHGAHKSPIWIPEMPVRGLKYNSFKNDPSAIHHFYIKLLNLKNNMNTKTAKKIAAARHKFMEKFLGEFFAEWEGKR